MKKIIYLLAISLAFVNFSCASIGKLFGLSCNCPNCKDGVCACATCNGKSPVIYTGGIAQQQGSASLTEEQARRRAMLDSLENLDFTIEDYDIPDVEDRVRKPYIWDDEEVIDAPVDSLQSFFKVTSLGSDIQFIHKEINADVTNNDIYFYFTMKDGVPGPLHLVVHYYADDPIEFHTLKIYIDGFNYEFKPVNIKRETQGKFYIERFDNEFKNENRDVATALAKCQYAGNILLASKSVSHRIYLSEEQIKHFRDTYQLYRKLGGKL